MKYKPELGLWGNIKLALEELTKEQSARSDADTENREAVEQALTDQWLDGVQAQQDITDIQLQLLGG